ncbi:hypothetical protein HWB91_gp63 [Bacillus phage vB_BboS-125]|uniref:Uncharacterized protein n=1 Tax=Bacillus phage vB_BboS-125 TaxID=2419618 RepID=A0A3G3BVZ4_9CAUD|nr:hypothetical protein HWB91_gp63 [Bacillus phage vB_BboS-125]AYP68433.1 hypothetical protein BboS125_00064 [Bacillus phage vB_BboS-125]
MTGIRVEGYVSKKAIQRWLENYEYLEAGDTPPDTPPTNSGPKNQDGISGGQLNKLMLDQAIENLPPLAKACILARWVHKLSRAKTLRVLGISDAIYRNRCSLGIDLIHSEINGEVGRYKALADKILQKP